MSDYGTAEKLRDPNDPCTCGHLAMEHYLRAGIYTECAGWCPEGKCMKFTAVSPARTIPTPTSTPPR